MKKILIIILSLITFSLQAQSRKEIADEAMKSWIGSNEHDVIMQFGSPTSTTSDGAGGKVMRYSQTTSTVVGTPLYGGSVVGTSVEQVQFYEFNINSSGIVYSSKTNMYFTKRQSERIHKKETMSSPAISDAPSQNNKPQEQSVPKTKSKVERLQELKQMFDEKLITQDEYGKEKKKILDEK